MSNRYEITEIVPVGDDFREEDYVWQKIDFNEEIDPAGLFEEKYGFSQIKFTDLVELELENSEEVKVYVPKLKNIIPDPKNKVDHLVVNCDVYFTLFLDAFLIDDIWHHEVIVHIDNLTPADMLYPKFVAKMTAESFPSKWSLFPVIREELAADALLKLLGIPSDQIAGVIDQFEFDQETEVRTFRILDDVKLCVSADDEGSMIYKYSTSEDNYTSFVEKYGFMRDDDNPKVYVLRNGNLLFHTPGEDSTAAYLQIAP